MKKLILAVATIFLMAANDAGAVMTVAEKFFQNLKSSKPERHPDYLSELATYQKVIYPDFKMINFDELRDFVSMCSTEKIQLLGTEGPHSLYDIHMRCDGPNHPRGGYYMRVHAVNNVIADVILREYVLAPPRPLSKQ